MSAHIGIDPASLVPAQREAKRGAKGKRKLWTLRRAVRVAGEWYDATNGDEMIWPTTGAAPRGKERV